VKNIEEIAQSENVEPAQDAASIEALTAHRALRVLKMLLRRLLWCVIAASTLEICARLDDWTSHGASPWGIYDSSVLNAYDTLGQHGQPNAQYLKWKLNSLGFRGPELNPKAVRILCVGSSETFGQMESENREWPRQVEWLLNKDADGKATYQLVNTGFPGETFPTSVIRLPERLAEVRPKFALIYPSLAHYLYVPYLAAKTPPPPPIPYFRFRMQSRIETTLKQVLPIWFQTWLREREITKQETRYGPTQDHIPVALETRFESDLKNAISLIRKGGAEPILITHANRFKDHVASEERFMLVSWRVFYPMLKESGFLSMEDSMNGVIRKVAAAEEIALLDAAPAMPTGPKYFSDFVHFTDKGAEIFSQFVAGHLAPNLTSDSTSKPHLSVGAGGARCSARTLQAKGGSTKVSREASR
jgi:lysophospholipase L1-like esterase